MFINKFQIDILQPEMIPSVRWIFLPWERVYRDNAYFGISSLHCHGQIACDVSSQPFVRFFCSPLWRALWRGRRPWESLGWGRACPRSGRRSAASQWTRAPPPPGCCAPSLCGSGPELQKHILTFRIAIHEYQCPEYGATNIVLIRCIPCHRADNSIRYCYVF